jgi:transcriptional regulator with XRE-family HTH domain
LDYNIKIGGNNMDFKDRLKEIRQEKGLSQTELGKIFNLSKQTISSYENDGSFPNQDTLNKLADYFDVSVDWLLGRVSE